MISLAKEIMPYVAMVKDNKNVLITPSAAKILAEKLNIVVKVNYDFSRQEDVYYTELCFTHEGISIARTSYVKASDIKQMTQMVAYRQRMYHACWLTGLIDMSFLMFPSVMANTIQDIVDYIELQ